MRAVLLLLLFTISAHGTVSTWRDPPAWSGDARCSGIIESVDLQSRTVKVAGRDLPVAPDAELLRGTIQIQLPALAPVWKGLGQEARWRVNAQGQIQYLVAYYHAVEVLLGPRDGQGRWARPVEDGPWRLLFPRPGVLLQTEAETALVVLDWEGKVRYFSPLDEGIQP